MHFKTLPFSTFFDLLERVFVQLLVRQGKQNGFRTQSLSQAQPDHQQGVVVQPSTGFWLVHTPALNTCERKNKDVPISKLLRRM